MGSRAKLSSSLPAAEMMAAQMNENIPWKWIFLFRE
jgi:hypothetical protein